MTDAAHKTRTLCLAGVLHAFTHIYQVALLPLYLPMQADFKLASEGQATLLVTVMMVSYFLPSYPMGVLADRVSRKKLLGLGLLINGLGFIGLGLAPNYALALAGVVVAGLGGSFFHPAATALVARLFPVSTGRALGLLGIGAGVGFFIGPVYAGWHAEQTGNWRVPVLVLGGLGVIAAGLFAWLAEEERAAPSGGPTAKLPGGLFPTPALWAFFIAAAVAFSLRDFVGSSMGTLGSLFLQHAHGFTLQETGLALSGIFLAGTVSNPIFGHLSDRGRLRWTSLALLLAMVAVALFPHVPRKGTFPALMFYGFFFMASYPTVEAALMVSVPDAVRGRVFGLWITIGGLMGNLSHWLVGRWVEGIGDKAISPQGYYMFYGVLGSLLLLSLGGLPCLHAIRKREHLEGDAAETSSGLPTPHSAL
jgi:FSR family fosmidomycin resistance protein-like MFS transporter